MAERIWYNIPFSLCDLVAMESDITFLFHSYVREWSKYRMRGESEMEDKREPHDWMMIFICYVSYFSLCAISLVSTS